MANLRKLKDQAAEHARKGRWAKAAELLGAVVAGDARDLTSKQKLAEALRRSGQPGDAIRIYREVADVYAGQGELIKAIAVCKVILDVDPSHGAAQAALADLYARRRDEPTRPVGLTPGRGLTTGVPDAPALNEPTREIALEVESLAGGSSDEVVDDGPPVWLERGSPSVLVPPPTPEVAAARAEALGEVTYDLEPTEEHRLSAGIVEPVRSWQPPQLQPVSPASPVQPPAPSRPVQPAAPPQIFQPPPPAQTFQPPAPSRPVEPPAPPQAVLAPPQFSQPSQQAEREEPEVLELLEMVIEPDQELPPEPEPAGAPSLPEVPLFSGLPREAFLALAAGFGRVEAPAGAAVVREGDRGRSLYVVALGRLRVERARPDGPAVIARVGEGDFFGEMALLSGEPRMASVVAEEDSELLEIGADALAGICRAHPAVAASLARFYRQRLLANAMATSPVFAPFGADDRAALVRRFQPREVKPGQILVREGERSEGLFVALSGRFEVVKSGGGAAVKVATLREGDLFGEMSCLRRQPAAASVVATRRGIVLRLPRDEFTEVASSHPQVLELVSGLADERQQSLESLQAAPKRGPGPYYV
jgi:CRP-like cAMP-binding protein